VVDPARVRREVPLDDIVDAVRAPLEAGCADDLATVLAHVGARRRARVRAALLAERIGARPATGVWTLRTPLGAPLGHLARRARIPRLLAALLSAHFIEYALILFS
jgi:hypothetical protein